MHKEVIIALVSVGISVATFWYWERIISQFANGVFPEYGAWGIAIGGLVFSAALLSISSFLLQNRWIAYATAIIGMSAPYVVLCAHSGRGICAGVATAGSIAAASLAGILCVTLFVRRIRKESETIAGVSVSRVARSNLFYYFVSATLILSMFYFFSLDEKRALQALVPRPAVEATFKLFANELSLPQTPDISNALYEAVRVRLEELVEPYHQYLVAAATVAFFFTVKLFTIPLYFAVTFFVFLLIKILLALKIVRKEIRQVEIERLTL